MRAGPRLLVPPVLLLLSASGCKNSLNYAPPGGPLGCSDPGAICGVGGYDHVGDGGPALSASFVDPTALARDAAGNLYIADRAQNRIRRIDAATGEISTVAGTGEESYAFVPGLPGDETLVSSPISVAVTDDGTVFWSDERSCAIYAISPSSGTVSLAAGSRCTSDTSGIDPENVFFRFDDCSRIRARGNDLIIPSTERSEIRYWNRGPTSTVVAGITIAPNTIPVVAGVLTPCEAAVTSVGGLLAIEANYLDCRLRYVSETGVTTFLIGSASSESTGCGSGGDGGPFAAAQLNYPSGIAIDATGHVWVSSLTAAKGNLVRFDRAGRPAGSFSVPPMPERVAADSRGNVWVSHMVGPAARKLTVLSDNGARQVALWTGFKNQAVAVDAEGLGWVANTEYVIDGEQGYLASNPLTNTVTRLTPGGRILGTYSAGADAWAVKMAPWGDVWVVNHLGDSVTRLTP